MQKFIYNVELKEDGLVWLGISGKPITEKFEVEQIQFSMTPDAAQELSAVLARHAGGNSQTDEPETIKEG